MNKWRCLQTSAFSANKKSVVRDPWWWALLIINVAWTSTVSTIHLISRKAVLQTTYSCRMQQCRRSSSLSIEQQSMSLQNQLSVACNHWRKKCIHVHVLMVQDYASIMEHLIAFWNIEKLTGLSSEAQQAQDFVCRLPARIHRLAERSQSRSTKGEPPQRKAFSWIHNRQVDLLWMELHFSSERTIDSMYYYYYFVWIPVCMYRFYSFVNSSYVVYLLSCR